MNGVKVFISYSHDSSEHKERVRQFANQLRADGIDASIDQYESHPPESWPLWMERQIEDADLVLIVFTETYFRRARGEEIEGIGLGASWEGAIIRNELYQQVFENTKFIPILFDPVDREFILTPLAGGTHYLIRRPDLDDGGYSDLLRFALNKPSVEKPTLGNTPTLKATAEQPNLWPVNEEILSSEISRVTCPGVLRSVLDRLFPRVHRYLTNLGTLSKPPELDDLNRYLRDQRAQIENDIKNKTYLPLRAKGLPQTTEVQRENDPFVRPIHQIVRHVSGKACGGDSASAQIAAVNRRSRVVRNILKTLLRHNDPLILLGDPGTGKTMTLQQATLALASSEIPRVFPIITIYVRLGEFRVERSHGVISSDDVLDYVRLSLPEYMRKYVTDLDKTGRLVVLFDGMDEMSREKYNEHTEALSVFGGSRRGLTKTLFSCRITDFSPKFVHRRLVLLPFSQSQIYEYLKKYIGRSSLYIDGDSWTLRRLARHLSAGGLPIEANNPFVLWLLCFHLQHNESWPKSRVSLLEFYNRENYQRKESDLPDGEAPFPDIDIAFETWSWIAFEITVRNRGAAISITDLEDANPENIDSILEAIQVGKRCGVLKESIEGHEYQIRFEHHRFQEFFTARHIHEQEIEISWIEKLDAPRWQETMLNLVLMGDADEVVDALVEGIYEPIASLKSESISDDLETVLSDRVELGTRMMRQSDAHPVIGETLKPCIEGAVSFLTENGNAITQVKMIRACHNLPNIDRIEALEKPRNSPIRWVRSQALALMASDSFGSKAIGSDLATEMSYDFANGVFLSRLPAYFKPVISSKRISNCYALLAILTCSLLNLAFALSVAVLLFYVVNQELEARTLSLVGEDTWAYEIIRTFSVWAYAVVVVASLIIGLRIESNQLWGIVPAAGAMVLILWTLVIFTWAYGAGTVLLMGIMLLLAGFYILPLYALISVFVHVITLCLSLLLTVKCRSSANRIRSFISLSWESWGYGELIHEGPGFLVFMAIMGAIVAFVRYVIFPIGHWIGETMGIPVLVISIILTVGFSVIVFCLIAYFRGNTRKEIMKSLASGIGFLGAIGFGPLLVLVIVFIGVWLNAYQTLGKVVSVVLAFLMTVVLLGAVFLCFRQLGTLLRWRRGLYPPGSFKPEDWKSKVRQANARGQNDLLLRTNHQSLSLNAEGFLEVLMEIQTSILKDPALSTYWEQRDQLEQVLKQERLG